MHSADQVVPERAVSATEVGTAAFQLSTEGRMRNRSLGASASVLRTLQGQGDIWRTRQSIDPSQRSTIQVRLRIARSPAL